jgi:hypothetical protein
MHAPILSDNATALLRPRPFVKVMPASKPANTANMTDSPALKCQ